LVRRPTLGAKKTGAPASAPFSPDVSMSRFCFLLLLIRNDPNTMTGQPLRFVFNQATTPKIHLAIPTSEVRQSAYRHPTQGQSGVAQAMRISSV
jgi:hypothetical protein